MNTLATLYFAGFVATLCVPFLLLFANHAKALAAKGAGPFQVAATTFVFCSVWFIAIPVSFAIVLSRPKKK